MRVFSKITAVLLALLCVISCGKDEAELEVDTLIVSGTVFAADTGEPLESVKVSLMGFDSDDEKMTMTPLVTKQTYTDIGGDYKITLIGPRAQKYYKIVASDESALRQGENYKSSLILFYISDGTAYNPRTKTYELLSQDFYLKK